MMGQKKFNRKQHHELCLDDFVKPTNLYRKIDKVIDFSFVYDLVKASYSQIGQPSLDPVVFFKIELVGFLEGIHEDRALERRIHDSFAIRWFLGYDLDETLPVHSTISRTRKDRMTFEVYEAVFDHILKLCVRHQLVSGSHQSIDSTLLKANSSLRSAEDLKGHVREHYKKARSSQTVEEDQKSDPPNPPQVSRCRDTEARVTRKPGFDARAYYRASAATDSKHGVVTHAQVNHANQNDMQLLNDLVLRTGRRLSQQGLSLQSAGVDGGYYSAENLKFAEEYRLNLYVPPNLQTQNKGLYRLDRFQYDSVKDQLTCPAGKILKFRETGKLPHMKKYCAQRKDCRVCSQKSLCTHTEFKRIQRSSHYELIQVAVKKIQSWEGKAAMRLRQIYAEGTFAQLKAVLKFNRIGCLGLMSAQKKFVMACAVINLKKLMGERPRIIASLLILKLRRFIFIKDHPFPSPQALCC